MSWLTLLTWTAASYAVGCANSAYYLLRRRAGADVRTLGSGNAGATNAGRVAGRRAFATVLLLDVARGALAVAAARALGLGDVGAGAAMVAVVAGHVWPAQLGFRGGKGVGPAMGAALVADWATAVAAGVVFGILYLATRRYSASGLAAIASAPAWAGLLGRPAPLVASTALLAALVVGAHVGPSRRRRAEGVLR
jgi:glycerol-3-phosphate acyltransferase PlsY